MFTVKVTLKAVKIFRQKERGRVVVSVSSFILGSASL